MIEEDEIEDLNGPLVILLTVVSVLSMLIGAFLTLLLQYFFYL